MKEINVRKSRYVVGQCKYGIDCPHIICQQDRYKIRSGVSHPGIQRAGQFPPLISNDLNP
jgi:hypothetical protein